MIIRKDDSTETTINLDSFTNKKQIREHLLKIFINEDCEKKYRYFVEKVANKNIYIERPGRLNKGCDFVILIEDKFTFKNNNDKPPKHDDLINDLNNKKTILTGEQWNKLKEAIKKIHDVEPFEVAILELKNFPLNSEGFSYELVLKLVKWFFIEQDITYWSGQGRVMLYNIIINL